MADMTPEQVNELTGEGTATKSLMGKMGGIKGLGTQMLGLWFLNKLLQTRNESKTRDIQIGGMREQASLMTPENIYYQASLPGAQQEEEMARQALFNQISGGVLGPSLAQGEVRI